MVDRCPSNAPALCGLENMPLTTIQHLGVCWTSADSAPKTKNRPECAWCILIPQFRNHLKQTFLSQSPCLRSCCSGCCSPGRFRDRGLVVAVAATGKNIALEFLNCFYRPMRTYIPLFRYDEPLIVNMKLGSSILVFFCVFHNPYTVLWPKTTNSDH